MKVGNLVLAFGLVGALPLGAAIVPATLINDNMVLQRDKPVPIWGTATAGNEIEVTFAGQSQTTRVAADGSWRVDLEPMPAEAEGRELVIVESEPGWFGSTVDEKTLTNVVVGEVWLCGGQSNMTFAMWPNPSVGQHAGREMNGYYDLMLTREPLIRGVHMPCCWSPVEKDHAALAWKPFLPESNLGGFSAAAWHFALRLKTSLGIPVGVIECAWGGSCIETWIPPFAYAASKSFKSYATSAIPTGVDKNGKKLDSHQKPRACWNAMVHPLAPYALRGAIWYQGCSNRGVWRQYYEMLETLRAGWGAAFGCGPKMPFFICQITPYGYASEEKDAGTVEIREEMERWGRDNAPLAGCINISDVGEIDCIHPGDKRTVGTRLAAMALNRLYGFKDLKCDGPTFRAAKLSADGRKVTLSFDHVTGWCRKGTYPERFELAGSDGAYVPVACHYVAGVPTIDLDVPAKMVPKKVAYLRKGCVHSFIKNEAGIPLGPFRGDVTAGRAGARTAPAEVHPDATSRAWKPLFARDLANATFKPGAWKMTPDGVLVSMRPTPIWTNEDYENYVLDLEYKMEKNGNSGVFIHITHLDQFPKYKIEVQLLDDLSPKFAGKEAPYQQTGSLYGRAPALEVTSKPAGAWNRMTIYCAGRKVRVVHNGKAVVDANMDDWKDPLVNPDGTTVPSWHRGFPALSTIPSKGRIGFQGVHGEAGVSVRNLRIAPL